MFHVSKCGRKKAHGISHKMNMIFTTILNVSVNNSLMNNGEFSQMEKLDF